MEEEQPQYIELLSENDMEMYKTLRKTLTSSENRNCRNKRLESFSEMLKSIKNYAIRQDNNDWKRCIVCGVCWLSDGIAVNTHQLSILLGKCKSSINGSLHRMKYVPFPSSNKASTELMELIPKLKTNFAELRQWTLRKQVVFTPQPAMNVFTAPTNDNTFQTPEPVLNANDYFSSFIDDNFQNQQVQQSQNSVEEFFKDPFGIPLSEWTESSSFGQFESSHK